MSTLPSATELRRITSELRQGPLDRDGYRRFSHALYASCWETVLCERISRKLKARAEHAAGEPLRTRGPKRVVDVVFTSTELAVDCPHAQLLSDPVDTARRMRSQEEMRQRDRTWDLNPDVPKGTSTWTPDPDLYDYIKQRVEENASGLRCMIDRTLETYGFRVVIAWE